MPGRRMTLARRLRFSLLVLGIGCASPLPPGPPRTSLLEVAGHAPDYPSPGRWRYHPRQPAPMLARESSGAAAIYAGERGERWQVDSRARAAAHLGPEPLVSILRPNPKRWVFLGASGTVYESESPLGPFLRVAAPVDPLVRVRAAGAALLGVRMDGRLVRSGDQGQSWTAVGPLGSHFSDVALLEDGTGLALAIPERFWTTRDFGQSWRLVDSEPVGALELADGGRGALLVEGVLGSLRFDPAARTDAANPATFAPVRVPPEAPVYRLGVEPRRGPDAGALTEGRAVITGGRYYELERNREGAPDWRLWQGSVHGDLSESPLAIARDCHTVRLSGFEQRLVVSCWRQSPTSSTQPVELFSSQDGSRTWSALSVTLWARLADFELTMGRGGALIATGVCASRDAEHGCRPHGIHYLAPMSRPRASGRQSLPPRGSRQAFEFLPAATPAAGGTADTLAFSVDGTVAYAAMARTQGRSYALYVSQDGGHSFVAHELGRVRSRSSSQDDEDFSASYRRRAGPAVTIAVAEDGTVAMVLREGDALRLFVTDQHGQVLSVTDPPAGVGGLGAVGVRALAFSTSSGEAWESLDGGGGWEEIGRLPLPLCRGDEACRLPVICHLAGCVIGDQLSRVGWRGQADSTLKLPALPAKRPRELVERKVATPLACTLLPEPWKRIDGAEAVPRADQAALGRVAWFVAGFDHTKGAFVVVHGLGGPRPQVERKTLLPPTPAESGYVRYWSLQVEGVAALRYRVGKAAGSRLTDLEVGWENLIEGHLGRMRIGDGGAYQPGDYEAGPGGWQLGRPDLVSIAEGGLYLRLHAKARDAQETWFLDGSRVTRVPPVPWPKITHGTSRTEMVHVQGEHVPLLFVGNGTAVVRARRWSSTWDFKATATGLADPAKFGLAQSQDIAYLGTRAGLLVTRYDAARTAYQAWLYPFRASGAVVDAPVEVPTQVDAGDRPKSCSLAERNSTARVVMPPQAGSRHPVVVTDGSDAQRVFLTADAVMHGTPGKACVAAFEANQLEPTAGNEGQLETVLLPLDDLEHSWLFRLAPADPRQSPGFDYRLMTCRFDSSVEIPNVVYEAPGTLVPRH
jgi:hypothetical protein